jgi:hypothetical protein
MEKKASRKCVNTLLNSVSELHFVLDTKRGRHELRQRDTTGCPRARPARDHLILKGRFLLFFWGGVVYLRRFLSN